MPEPQRANNPTTVVTLREYVDQRLADMQRHYDTRLEAVQDATTVACEANERRLAGLNEFRAQLSDQAARLITRAEVDLLIARVDADIKSLQLTRAALEGKASQASVNAAQLMAWIGIALGVVGTLLSIIRALGGP